MAAVAVLTAISPFMPGDPSLAAAGGAIAGALVLGFRLWRRRGESAIPAASVRLSAPFTVWVSLALFAVTMAPTGRWMYRMWTANIWENGHSVFVPLIILYFAHRNLLRVDDRSAQQERGGEESSAWGLPIIIVGLVVVILDTAIGSRYLSSAGFLLCIPGLSLLLLGTRRTRKILFPLTLCLFLLPFPYSLGEQLLLRDATAVTIEPVLRALGFPVVRELTVLMLPSFTIDISAQCSGFSALYASSFAAVILAVHSEHKWRGALLLLSVWPIALAANVLRAAALVALMDSFGRDILATRIHPASGAATFVIALAALYLLAGRRTIRAVLA